MNTLLRSITGVIAAVILSALPAGYAAAQQKVLKFIPQADLRILDPIATTAYITRTPTAIAIHTLLDRRAAA